MRYVLIILLLPFISFSQIGITYPSVYKGTGIMKANPNGVFTTYNTPLILDTVTNTIYIWQGGNEWKPLGGEFDGDRPIARVPGVGDNIGSSTVNEWLEWWYTANYQQPSITMNLLSPYLVEVGTSNNYLLSGSIQNPCDFTLSNGLVNGTSFVGTTYFENANFSPTSVTSTTFQSSIDWGETGSTCADGSPDTGTATASRTVSSVYPVLWGMSATSYTGGSAPYSIWNKRITTEGNLDTLTMTGTNEYIYILIPKTWSDFNVSIIYDHNGFNVTPSFTAYDVSVTSTGLINNWTQDYKLYKLNNLTTANNFNYVYIR